MAENTCGYSSRRGLLPCTWHPLPRGVRESMASCILGGRLGTSATWIWVAGDEVLVDGGEGLVDGRGDDSGSRRGGAGWIWVASGEVRPCGWPAGRGWWMAAGMIQVPDEEVRVDLGGRRRGAAVRVAGEEVQVTGSGDDPGGRRRGRSRWSAWRSGWPAWRSGQSAWRWSWTEAATRSSGCNEPERERTGRKNHEGRGVFFLSP
ncbi:unnamed protein product [Urochloa humidicola]